MRLSLCILEKELIDVCYGTVIFDFIELCRSVDIEQHILFFGTHPENTYQCQCQRHTVCDGSESQKLRLSVLFDSRVTGPCDQGRFSQCTHYLCTGISTLKTVDTLKLRTAFNVDMCWANPYTGVTHGTLCVLSLFLMKFFEAVYQFDFLIITVNVTAAFSIIDGLNSLFIVHNRLYSGIWTDIDTEVLFQFYDIINQKTCNNKKCPHHDCMFTRMLDIFEKIFRRYEKPDKISCCDKGEYRPD